MPDILVICEGKTERLFVNELLTAYFPNLSIRGIEIGKCQGKGCGGGVSYSKFIKDLQPALNEYDHITTFFDYYGRGEGWPKYKGEVNDPPIKKVKELEKNTLDKIHKEFPDIKEGCIFPFFVLHEFEALLFSDVQQMHNKLRQPLELFEAVIKECKEPEFINDNPDTAPSKRINAICDNYRKTVKGMRVARAVTIEKMRQECPHFRSWLEKFETLKK